MKVLAFDGAGLYGYNAALWLRELCRQDPSFLRGDQVGLFAGTSAGALTSLLLARAENPRDVVLSGELERFWSLPGCFSNDSVNPWVWLGSWCGFTGYYGGRPFREELDRVFGDATLGDLVHPVYVCTFDWSGVGSIPGPDESGKGMGPWLALGVESWTAWLGSVAQVATDRNPFVEGHHHHPCARPLAISTLPQLAREGESTARIADLAYVAATPLGMRAMRGGLGDAAAYCANPANEALAALIGVARRDNESVAGQHPLVETVKDLAMMSFGDGSARSHLSPGTGNFGAWRTMMLPSNAHDVWPPQAYPFQPGDFEATQMCRSILGAERFFRFNPPMIDLPMAVAAYLSRLPNLRANMIQAMNTGLQREHTSRQLARAKDWLETSSWATS